MRFLTKAVPLQHPSPQAELFLASDSQIGGIIQQKSGDHWRPFGFFFRNLSDMESHYSTIPESCLTWNLIISHDQELLAAYASIQHFSHFCEGRPYQLWTLSALLAMSSQAFFDQWSLKNSEKTFFSPAQHFPPREAYLWAACLFLDMSGAVLPGCAACAWTCLHCRARFTATPGPSRCTSSSPNGSSLICMLIWWAVAIQ
jgi:hypothetical protein